MSPSAYSYFKSYITIKLVSTKNSHSKAHLTGGNDFSFFYTGNVKLIFIRQPTVGCKTSVGCESFNPKVFPPKQIVSVIISLSFGVKNRLK